MTPISLPSLVAGTPVGVGPEPVDVFIAAGGTTALVANFQTSAVTPISLPGLVPAPAIYLAANPTGIAGLSPTTVYVSGGDSVTPVDLLTREAGPGIDVGTTAEGLALAPDSSTAWVCGGDGTLVHVDLVNRSVIGRVTVGNQPSAVVIAAGRSSH